jgi:hypothetical protein
MLITQKWFLPVLLFLSLSLSPANAQERLKDFLPLHSLAGIWKMETSRGTLYECWQIINDSTLKSQSYKVNGKDTVQLEQVQLILRNGRIQYIPVVKDENNGEAIAFTLSNYENKNYTFENKTHDFPQRIVYVIPQGNFLHAWIEGEVNGKPKKIDYNYSKL